MRGEVAAAVSALEAAVERGLAREWWIYQPAARRVGGTGRETNPVPAPHSCAKGR